MENLISSSVIDTWGAEILANAYIKWKWIDYSVAFVLIIFYILNRF